MSEFSAYRDEEELDAEEGGADVPSFEIGMFSPGHPIEDFRLKNDPHEPLQRSDLVQRKGAMLITLRCADVVHGDWGGGTDDKATLVVVSFKFHPRKHGSHRIKHVAMEFSFASMDGVHRNYPEVANISLDGTYGLAQTTRDEETTAGTEGTLGGGALGLQASTTLKWERKISQQTSDATFVYGATYRDPTTASYNNCATWSLEENGTEKTGVPSHLRVGMLVRRRDDEPFQCQIKLKTTSDFFTQLLEKKHEGVDNLLFDPSKAPTNKLKTYDTSELGSFVLSDIEAVTMWNIREDAIKTVGG